jgi:hypothetical protein
MQSTTWVTAGATAFVVILLAVPAYLRTMVSC